MKTKTIVLFAILFLASATNSRAQKGFWMELSTEAKNSKGEEYKVPLDPLSSSPSWIAMEKKFTLRGSIGADLGYYFSDYMGLSLGLHYSGYGQDYDEYVWSIGGGSIIAERKVSLHYLNLPLQLRYTTAPAQKISFIMAAGFYVDFLLNYGIENKYTASDGASVTAEATGDTYTLTLHDNTGTYTETAMLMSEPFNPGDVGAILSAGFEIKFNDQMSLPVMLKYQVGFGNVKNKSSQYSYQGDTYLYWEDDFISSPNLNSDFNNSSIGIKIGLRFGL